MGGTETGWQLGEASEKWNQKGRRDFEEGMEKGSKERVENRIIGGMVVGWMCYENICDGFRGKSAR